MLWTVLALLSFLILLCLAYPFILIDESKNKPMVYSGAIFQKSVQEAVRSAAKM